MELKMPLDITVPKDDGLARDMPAIIRETRVAIASLTTDSAAVVAAATAGTLAGITTATNNAIAATANANAVVADLDVIAVDTTAGPVVIGLPLLKKRASYVKTSSDANSVTFTTTDGSTLAEPNLSLTAQYQNIAFNKIGNVWYQGNTAETFQVVVPTDVATLEIARTRADCANKTIVVASNLTQAQSNITGDWPNDRGLEFRFGGSLLNSTTFNFADSRVLNSWKGYVFKGAGSITGLQESRPEWFGATTGATLHAAQFTAAINALVVGGVLNIDTGYWNVGILTVPLPFIKIKGSGKPIYNRVTARLSGGTILCGMVHMNNMVGASVDSLGVDQTDAGPLINVAAILQGVAGNAYLGQSFEHITCLGRGFTLPGGAYPADTAHGIALESGTHSYVNDINLYKFGHGIALKTSNSNISNIYIEDSSYDGLIVKSDSTHTPIENVNVSNVVSKNIMSGGNAVVIVQAYDSSSLVKNVNISNVTVQNGGVAAVLVAKATGGMLNGINLSNVVGWGTMTNGFSNDGGLDVTVNGFQSFGATNYSFTNNSDFVTLSGAVSRTPGIKDFSGAFYGLINGKELVIDLPVFANNAAAVAGYYTVGSRYLTPTGQLMVVY